MKRFFKFVYLFPIALLLSAFSMWLTMDWQIGENPTISFEGNKVKGHFKTLMGDIQFDPARMDKANFSFEIDVKSIETGKSLMNKHALSEDWLDAEQFPKIQFQSILFGKEEKDFWVEGNLSLHGITQQIRIPFTFENQLFKANFQIKREDFQIGSQEGMAKAVAPTIDLSVEIPVSPNVKSSAKD